MLIATDVYEGFHSRKSLIFVHAGRRTFLYLRSVHALQLFQMRRRGSRPGNIDNRVRGRNVRNFTQQLLEFFIVLLHFLSSSPPLSSCKLLQGRALFTSLENATPSSAAAIYNNTETQRETTMM
jgi:hypothetical protein